MQNRIAVCPTWYSGKDWESLPSIRRSRLVERHNLEKNGVDLQQPLPGWTNTQWSTLSKNVRRLVKQKDNPPTYEEYIALGGLGRPRRPKPPEYTGTDWETLTKYHRHRFWQSLSHRPPMGYRDNDWDILTQDERTAIRRKLTHPKVESLDDAGPMNRPDSLGNLQHSQIVKVRKTNVADIRARLSGYIRNQLDHDHHNHKKITNAFLSPFLPRLDAPESQLQIFEQLIENTITLPNQVLRQILNISESIGDDCPPQGGICYFISWELTNLQLSNLMKDMKGQQSVEFSCVQFYSWEEQTRSLKDNDHVFIRYVGQTINKTPDERYRSSTFHTDRATTYEIFNKYLKKSLPTESYTRRIFNLTDTFVRRPILHEVSEMNETVGTIRGMHEDIDLYECIAICLLGPKSLLNTHTGGRLFMYSPSKLDAILFHGMGTSVVRRLMQLNLTEILPDEEKRSLSEISQTRCEWTRESSGQDSISIEENEKQIQASFLQDTSSQLVEGQRLLCIIGDAPTKRAIQESSGFLSGSSRTALVIHSILDVISDLESTSFPNISEAKVSRTFFRLMSFINVFPFPMQSSKVVDEKAKEALRSYLHVVQPILVITLGACALGHCSGKYTSNLVQNAGKAYIQELGAKDHRKFSIVIPHVHPGFNARSYQSSAEKRLYVLCWFIAWMFVDIALQQLGLEGETGRSNRHTLCTTIMKEAQDRLTRTGLEEELEQAKRGLLQHLRTQRGRGGGGPRNLNVSGNNTQSSRCRSPEATPQSKRRKVKEGVSSDQEDAD